MGLYVISFFMNTGGPRYSRGLRSLKVPRIQKPRITREPCFDQYVRLRINKKCFKTRE